MDYKHRNATTYTKLMESKIYSSTKSKTKYIQETKVRNSAKYEKNLIYFQFRNTDTNQRCSSLVIIFFFRMWHVIINFKTSIAPPSAFDLAQYKYYVAKSRGKVISLLSQAFEVYVRKCKESLNQALRIIIREKCIAICKQLPFFSFLLQFLRFLPVLDPQFWISICLNQSNNVKLSMHLQELQQLRQI